MSASIIYKCACGAYHSWDFTGDCWDDGNRYGSPEDYAHRNKLDVDDIEIRSAAERELANDSDEEIEAEESEAYDIDEKSAIRNDNDDDDGEDGYFE